MSGTALRSRKVELAWLAFAVANVVDVCIRRLRKKLGSETPIETVRNAGYRVA